MAVDALITTRPRSFESNHLSFVPLFRVFPPRYWFTGVIKEWKGARRRENRERERERGREFVRGYDHWLNVVLAERCLLARTQGSKKAGERSCKKRRGKSKLPPPPRNHPDKTTRFASTSFSIYIWWNTPWASPWSPAGVKNPRRWWETEDYPRATIEGRSFDSSRENREKRNLSIYESVKATSIKVTRCLFAVA